MSRAIFITGVSSGIGYGLAQGYLQRGDVVFGVSRRTPDIDNPRFHFLSLDLCEAAGAQMGLCQFLQKDLELDTVVLNAGVLGQIGDMKDTSIDEMKRTMDVNLWSYKTVLDVLVEHCQLRKVFTISSGAAVNGNRGWNGYSISKAALNMLTQLYARENPDIYFAAVAPGLVDTAMQDYLCSQAPDARFGSLEALKSKRNTEEMPKPDAAAKKLISLFDSAENHVESGQFVDIRNLPELNQL